MSNKVKKAAITPTRVENFSAWYQEVIKAADLAENSDVRGCMVIKPWGFGIWENIQQALDQEFKRLGHENVYFPLFIPLKYLEKEAEHVEGFAKECAVVTHTRLQQDKSGALQPASPLDEPLIVRPTSETIIGQSFANWITSYRDLPLKINQWCNIVRWEMRTRMFLRTTEILWQEGHTAHSSEQEAVEHTKTMLKLYENFVREHLAIPSVMGEKTESEKFPGAVRTYTFELMMQDKKALQGGTSHYLGQNFSKAADIQFRAKNGDTLYAFTTSWGVTTRLIGAMLMVHSDDDGAIIPPRIAPYQIVIIPVIHKEEVREEVLEFCRDLQKKISKYSYWNRLMRCKVDERDLRGGEKAWQWRKKGVPIRLEIGPRDIEKKAVFLGRRDQGAKENVSIPINTLEKKLPEILDELHYHLYEKAAAFLKKNSKEIQNRDQLYTFFKKEGGFAYFFMCEDQKLEQELKEDLQITPRCLPMTTTEKRECIFTGQLTQRKVIFAKAY